MRASRRPHGPVRGAIRRSQVPILFQANQIIKSDGIQVEFKIRAKLIESLETQGWKHQGRETGGAAVLIGIGAGQDMAGGLRKRAVLGKTGGSGGGRGGEEG